MKEATFSSENLSNSYRQVTKEKYDLIEELTKEKDTNRSLFEQIKHEREEHTMFEAKFLKEIEVLQKEYDKNHWIIVCTTFLQTLIYNCIWFSFCRKKQSNKMWT